jgi:hypothetical protein
MSMIWVTGSKVLEKMCGQHRQVAERFQRLIGCIARRHGGHTELCDPGLLERVQKP